MKYFDRTKSQAKRQNALSRSVRRTHKKSPARLSTIINPLFILFVLILGLNGPRCILDYANIKSETKTFTQKDELKKSTDDIKKPTYPSSQNYIAPRSDHIALAGRNISIFRSGNTKINAGSRVGLYGNGFLYGHNTAAVFGSLGSIQSFSVTLGGVTKNYSVAKRITLPKTCQNSTECAEKYMGAFTSNQSYRGHSYSLVLMTCAGTPVGADDATHRLIVFANEI